MKVVKFLRSNAPYNAGERAAVADDFADRLAKSGVVEIEQRPEPQRQKKPHQDKATRPKDYNQKG